MNYTSLKASKVLKQSNYKKETNAVWLVVNPLDDRDYKYELTIRDEPIKDFEYISGIPAYPESLHSYINK